MKIITLEQAEELAMQTDYAVFAQDDDQPINEADAGAFFFEGYLYAIKWFSENENCPNCKKEYDRGIKDGKEIAVHGTTMWQD